MTVARPITTPDDRRTPPRFCQYADGACDQLFEGTTAAHGVALYSSNPTSIAATIEAAVGLLSSRLDTRWKTWREFSQTGQIIFCSICRNCRFADVVVADVTTFNFNVLFEIGFAIGLEIPVVPIRDTTFVRDRVHFDELGLLDTIGYLDFQNSEGLAQELKDRLPVAAIPAPIGADPRITPLYVLRAPIKTEGDVRLMAALKRQSLRFRPHDPTEVPRLSLQEARKAVASCHGVIGHLLHPDREGATVHNARCALVAGIGVASGKAVVLIQEGNVSQPIDYRSIVRAYDRPDQVSGLIEPVIKQSIARLQTANTSGIRVPARLLERLDLGDLAAENEISGLRSYFVRTGQFLEAKRGNARLVTGRKGSGKTAIFYGVRDSFAESRSSLVLDLKPEGYQFTRLREVVLKELTPGVQEHTLTALWNFILLCEIAQQVLDYEHSWAHREPQRSSAYDQLEAVYASYGSVDSGDFSERLIRQVDAVVARFEAAGDVRSGAALTNVLFRDDIRRLDDAVARYLQYKQEVWILVDNIDKSWSTWGATQADILIIRTLLEATRKLQRQCEDRGVALHALVFLRNDIYDHLVAETPDKGKDTVVRLDWDDPEVFREIVRQRISTSTGLQGDFDHVWSSVCEPFVGTRDSFAYMLDRTLMRPRDVLTFIHRAVEVAVNRGHSKITEADVLQAEHAFSEDMLVALMAEVRDVNPDFVDVVYNFIGKPAEMFEAEARMVLVEGALKPEEATEAVRLLLWFAFFGVRTQVDHEIQYSYGVRYNLRKLIALLERPGASLVVHPAFRRGLELTA